LELPGLAAGTVANIRRMTELFVFRRATRDRLFKSVRRGEHSAAGATSAAILSRKT
jgi:hypothetical protein